MKCWARWVISWVKIAGRYINNLSYVDDTTLMAESEEELKSLLMRVKEESENTSLKFSIKNNKIMASGPITLWQLDGGNFKVLTQLSYTEQLTQATVSGYSAKWGSLQTQNPPSYEGSLQVMVFVCLFVCFPLKKVLDSQPLRHRLLKSNFDYYRR